MNSFSKTILSSTTALMLLMADANSANFDEFFNHLLEHAKNINAFKEEISELDKDKIDIPQEMKTIEGEENPENKLEAAWVIIEDYYTGIQAQASILKEQADLAGFQAQNSPKHQAEKINTRLKELTDAFPVFQEKMDKELVKNAMDAQTLRDKFYQTMKFNFDVVDIQKKHEEVKKLLEDNKVYQYNYNNSLVGKAFYVNIAPVMGFQVARGIADKGVNKDVARNQTFRNVLGMMGDILAKGAVEVTEETEREFMGYAQTMFKELVALREKEKQMLPNFNTNVLGCKEESSKDEPRDKIITLERAVVNTA